MINLKLVIVYYDYYTTVTRTDSTIITFNDYIPSASNEGVLLFINSTYIEPDRYSLAGNTVTFLYEEIEEESKLTLAVPKDLVSNKVFKNNMIVETAKVEIIKDGQFEFDLPTNISHDNLFIFLGSMLLSESRYNLNGDRTKLYIYNMDDKLKAGHSLL